APRRPVRRHHPVAGTVRQQGAACRTGKGRGEATLRGTFQAVQVADLRASVGDPATFAVKGAIANVRPGKARLLEGIDLDIAGSTATAALAAWLDWSLPNLGPIAGQLTLSGSSEALKVTRLKFRAGAPEGPT